MSSVTATVNVQINAANAAGQLAALQAQVANMNKGMLAATAGGVMAQEKAIKRMGNVLSGSGMFTTGIRNVHTQLGRMHQEFDKGSTTLSKYRQNSKMWGKDHTAMNALAADRVKMLQSQYVALGKEMNGVQKAMEIKPDRMMREFGADAMYANQQQMLFRRNLQMGATSLVNWGKNTQWAGRQMMVGMGIPIAIASAGAIKAFNEIEKSSIAFKRVYGDTTTSVAEKSQMLTTVQKGVAKEMTQYGIAVGDTLDVAAKAAATGAQGADLIAATKETMRLATLGNMDYGRALESTIAMQTAFGISSDEMARKTDFLNAVENQTILSMEDMALAVPRVAPVIKGLGGGVEELAIMMTALRQGGVSAEQGANALKSGLASMINPTATATEALDSMGVNLNKIVNTNKGDIIGTVKDLGSALDGLSKFQRQQALESLFGKYQYARMGALLKNINSKAVKETMRMAKASDQELAQMSSQELSQISDSPMIKLQASIERLKAAAAPLGAVLSDIGAKVIGFMTPVVSFFSDNSWATKALIGVAGFAAIAGTLTMIVGVLANFAGSMVKAGMAVKNFFRIISGRGSLAYIASSELEATAAANSLASASERAAAAHMAQANAAKLLVSELNALAAAQLKAAGVTGTQSGKVAPVKPGTPTPPPVTPTVAPTARPIPKVLPPGTNYESQGIRSVLSQYQRAHLYRPDDILPGSAMYQRISERFAGTTDSSNAPIRTALANSEKLKGYNNYAFLMKGILNQDMDNAGGVPAKMLLKDATELGGHVAAPFFHNLWRAMGRPDVSQFHAQMAPHAQAMVGEYVNALQGAAARGEVITGQGYEKIMRPVVEKFWGGVSDEVRAARPAMETPSQLSGESFVRRRIAQLKGGIAAWGKDKPTNVTTQVGTMAPMLDKVNAVATVGADTPTVVTDRQGKVTAAVIPETPQAKAALSRIVSPTGTFPSSPISSRPVGIVPPTGTFPSSPLSSRPMPGDQYQTMSRRQFTGNGLMGVGMGAMMASSLAQMMGKQISPAVDMAATGLMGVGMVAQSFPGMMAKLSAPLGAAATALGPFGLAIGAVIAAFGGAALFWRKFNIDARERGNQYGKAIADATYYANEVGSAFGNTSFVTQQQVKEAGTTEEAVSTSKQFLDSSAGKQWLESNSKLMMKFGPAVASSSLATQVAGWVVQGVLTGENAKSLIAAMNMQAPGTGAALQGPLTEMLGKDFEAYNPAKVANDMLSIQGQNAQQALGTMTQQKQDASGASTGDLAKSFLQLGIPGIPSKIKDFASTVGDSGWGDAIKGALPFAGPVGKELDQRARTEELTAATAGVWNSQLKTAFANRMAIEARLKQMITDRDDLASKKKAGTATDEELQSLKALDQQITKTQASSKLFDQNIASSFAQMKGMNDLGGQSWFDAQLDSARNSGKKDSSGYTTWAAEAINDANGTTMDVGQANKSLSALNTGMISPAAIMNITKFGKNMGKLPAIIDALPAPKLQDFATQVGNMTGPQAQAALQSFGSRFTKAAVAAKLSGKEAAAAAKALGATPAQVKDVKVNVKAGKVTDPGAKIQANRNISVGANTGRAQSQIEKLRKEAERVSGKKIVIKASDNAGEVIARLRKIIKAADDADGKKHKIKVDADTSQAEAKAERVEAALSKGNPPPITISATDKATATMVGIQAQWVTTQAVLSTPPTLAVTDLASPALTTVIGLFSSINDKTVTLTVNKVENGSIGGYFAYASGGMHRGDGKVVGPGGPTDDKVNAHLSNGEFVIRASSVKKYGPSFVSAVNQGTLKDVPRFAKGGGIKKLNVPLPPKGRDKPSRQESFNEDYQSVLRDARNAAIEINAFQAILKKAGKSLGEGFKGFRKEFATYLIDNFEPKQIFKMLNGKGKGVIARQFEAEKKMAFIQEKQSLAVSKKSSKFRADLLRSRGLIGDVPEGKQGEADAISNLSDEQIQMYNSIRVKKKGGKVNKKKTKVQQDKFLKSILEANKAETDIEEYNTSVLRKKEVSQAYNSATGNTLRQAATGAGISVSDMNKYSDALGMSVEDIVQQIKDGDLPENFEALGKAALDARDALEVLNMSATDRQSEQMSINQTLMDNIQEHAAINARRQIKSQLGASQGQLEANIAVEDAQNAIKQAQIDDINTKYSKQLEVLDQIGQQQQAIAGLERGRLTVAGALSQGDISAAAAAAQQQRSDAASFARDQMRQQLENQQKAQTTALQEQIEESARRTRDIQNQINLIIAQQNAAVATQVSDLQEANDYISVEGKYFEAINEQLAKRLELLKASTAELEAQAAIAAAAAAPPATAPGGGGGAPATGTGQLAGGGGAPSGAAFSAFDLAYGKLKNDDQNWLKKNVFSGADKGGGTWKSIWDGFSAIKRDGIVSRSESGNNLGPVEKDQILKLRSGGFVPGIGNYDRVSALLTPGEFVVNRMQAAKFGSTLRDINSGRMSSDDQQSGAGGINISKVEFIINGDNLDTREIADVVVKRLHSLDSATIRGGRFNG